jgi:hypothetical protein
MKKLWWRIYALIYLNKDSIILFVYFWGAASILLFIPHIYVLFFMKGATNVR